MMVMSLKLVKTHTIFGNQSAVQRLQRDVDKSVQKSVDKPWKGRGTELVHKASPPVEGFRPLPYRQKISYKIQ